MTTATFVRYGRMTSWMVGTSQCLHRERNVSLRSWNNGSSSLCSKYCDQGGRRSEGAAGDVTSTVSFGRVLGQRCEVLANLDCTFRWCPSPETTFLSAPFVYVRAFNQCGHTPSKSFSLPSQCTNLRARNPLPLSPEMLGLVPSTLPSLNSFNTLHARTI